MAANTGQHGTLVTKKSKAWIGKIYIAGKTYVAGNRPQWFGTYSAFASVIVSEAALPLTHGGCKCDESRQLFALRPAAWEHCDNATLCGLSFTFRLGSPLIVMTPVNTLLSFATSQRVVFSFTLTSRPRRAINSPSS